MGKVENWEIWVTPFYLMFIFCLAALFEQCVRSNGAPEPR